MIKIIDDLPKIEKEEIRKEFKVITKRPQSYLKVRALVKVNLGKLEKNGPTLWFEKGMERTVPYGPEYKRIIDQNIEGRFLEIVN